MATSAGTLAASAARHGTSRSDISFGLSSMWGTLDFITAPPLPWGAGIQFHNTVSISHPVPDEGTSYDPIAVERKWQRRWQERRTNEPDLKAAASPFYALMMFPYPSAEGLHVGNLFAFTGNDIYGRFQRLQGHTVFEPHGLRRVRHPLRELRAEGRRCIRCELIPQNIENFRRQLQRAGLMVDWQHELSTTDPTYYKWTQWIFLQLFKRGLAYKKKAAVNWCPNDKTVLANEQVDRRAVRALRRDASSSGCSSSGSSASPTTPSGCSHNLEWIDWSGVDEDARSATGSAAPRARRSIRSVSTIGARRQR